MADTDAIRAHARADVPALLDEIERLTEDLDAAERYMRRDHAIALQANTRLDAVRALHKPRDSATGQFQYCGHCTTFGEDGVVVAFVPSPCPTVRALDGESTTSIQPDDDCGGWTTNDDPPCGGCTACLRAQDNHRKRLNESTKDGA